MAVRPPRMIPPATVALAERFHEKFQRARLFEDTIGPRKLGIGSNWWIIAGRLTNSGFSMLASDPHLSLSTPPIWYEAHLVVANDAVRGAMNVSGVSLPGAPGIILGCNERICWGATVNPMDVTDWYQEHLVVDLSTMTPKGTVFEDNVEPVILIPQTFRVNQAGNGVADPRADLHRLAGARAGDAHHAAHGLGDHVVGRPVGIGAGAGARVSADKGLAAPLV